MTPYSATIFMAGDINVAKQVCREVCFARGLCVHVYPVDYIYTAGEESGFAVGLINYPRFPDTPNEIWEKAAFLARILRERCCQRSYTIHATDRVEWFTLDIPR